MQSPEEEKKWLVNLQIFIKDLLNKSNIIKNQNTFELFLRPESIRIFASAFTSFTYENNYEQLESLGDSILSSQIKRYLIGKYPNITASELSNTNQDITDNKYLSNIAKSLNFHLHIRILKDLEDIPAINADAFEAFIAALFSVANRIDGLGDSYCFNFIKYVYDQQGITVMGKSPSDKTRAIQLFDRFVGKDKKEAKYNESFTDTKPVIFTLSLKDNFIKILNEGDIKVDKLETIGKANTKSEAEKDAYKKMVELLDSYGINEKWVEKAKENFIFSHPSIKNIYEKASKYLEDDGLVSFDFFESKKLETNNFKYYILYGIDKRGHRKYLAHYKTYSDNKNKVDVYINLLEDYIDNH